MEVTLQPLQPVLVSDWQLSTKLYRMGSPLSDLIDYASLLSINGSIINRLFREANIPTHESAPILNTRYTKKKAIDKRNQRMRDRNSLSGLDSEVTHLAVFKQDLLEQKRTLESEISFYQQVLPINSQ